MEGNILALGNEAFWSNTNGVVFDIEKFKNVMVAAKNACTRHGSFTDVDPETGYSTTCLVSLTPNEQEDVKAELEQFFSQDQETRAFTVEVNQRMLSFKHWHSALAPADLKAYRTHQAYLDGSLAVVATGNGFGEIIFQESCVIRSFQKKVATFVEQKSSCGEAVRILDVGCATGFHTHAIINKHQGNVRVVGCDLSKEALAAYRGHLPNALRTHLSLVIGEFPSACTLKEDSCDLILNSHVLHYLAPDKAEASFAMMHALLKDDGVLCLQGLTPFSKPYAWRLGISQTGRQLGAERPGAFSGPWESESRFATGDNHANHRMPETGGYPVYPDELKKELEKAGFKVEIQYGRFDLPDCPSDLESPLPWQDHEWLVTRPLKESAQDKRRIKKLHKTLRHKAPALLHYIYLDRVNYANCLVEREKSIAARTPVKQESNDASKTEFDAQPWLVEPVPGILPLPATVPVQRAAQAWGMPLDQSIIIPLVTMSCVHVIATKVQGCAQLPPFA
jgi:SAM-dependent methyltransferase